MYKDIVEQAENLMENDNYRKALIVLEENKDMHLNSDYYTLLGYVSWRCGAFEKTIDYMEKSLELPSYDPEFFISEMEEDIDFYIENAKEQIIRENKIRALPKFKNKTIKSYPSLDLKNFWEDSEYNDKTYTESYPTDEMIEKVEKDLGFKLSQTYIELMKSRNGGVPKKTNFPSPCPTCWSEDSIGIENIKGIGFEKDYSLCGSFGSKDAIGNWYPEIGIAICDCPSAGHDMIFLDYRKCGSQGEPEVVHIDQESGFIITLLANNFKEFVTGLYFDED